MCAGRTHVRKLIPNNLEVALATARHVGYVLGMNTATAHYARRAGALLDRAISERKIGYTVSARTTAERALVWASTDAERAEVANLLAECGTVAYRLHRGQA